MFLWRWLGSRRARRVQAFSVLAVASALAIYATSASGSSGAEPSPTAEAPAPPGAKVVRELTKLRTATSDTFLRSDGSRELTVYADPINYRASDGSWQPIDDRLSRASDGSWQPGSSPVPISLPSSLDGGPVSVGPPARRLSLSLEGASSTQAVASGDQSTYENALPNVSASYTANSNSVRETLSVASASAPTIYSYKLSLSPGLHASLASDGQVLITDASGTVVYTLATPTVGDSSSNAQPPSSSFVHYQLSSDGSALSLVLDRGWLSDPKRVFPVRIDPDVYFNAQQDCTITSQKYATTSLCGGPLYVGPDSESPKDVSRSLLRFDLSSIPRGSVILSSGLKLWFEAEHSSSSPIEIAASALTREFTQHATWNSFNGSEPWTAAGGDYSSPYAGRQTLFTEWTGGWITFGFAPQVEAWVQHPSSNHGILLKAANETVSGYDAFRQTASSEKRPDMNIVYSSRLGNPEGAFMVGDQLAGGAEAAVNVADGNLLLSSPDVSYSGEGYETQLRRYYNSQDESLTGSSFGPGWLLSTGNDTLAYSSWWDGSYYFHESGGGWSRFDPSPPATGTENQNRLTYAAPPDLNAKFIVHEDKSRALTFNNSGVEWLFDNSGAGFPQKIVEGAGNTISLEYHESELSHLADTHGNALTIPRNHSTGHVTKIEGTGGTTRSYSYDPYNHLSSYEGQGGEKASYGYNSAGLLKQITDETGTYVISYDSSEPKRVTSIRRLVNGTVEKVGSEDETTSVEYISPTAPECSPETDLGETVVRTTGEAKPEVYCYNAADDITKWSRAEGEGSTKHTFGGEPTDPEEFCYAITRFSSRKGARYVSGHMSTFCGPKPQYQQIEVCLEQEYEGSWHASGTCREKPITGPTLTRTLSSYTGLIKTCTHGRHYRVWEWFYTPKGKPGLTTNFIPNQGGEPRC